MLNGENKQMNGESKQNADAEYLLRVRQFGLETALLADELRILCGQIFDARQQLIDMSAQLLLRAPSTFWLQRIGTLAAHTVRV